MIRSELAGWHGTALYCVKILETANSRILYITRQKLHLQAVDSLPSMYVYSREEESSYSKNNFVTLLFILTIFLEFND